MDSMTAAPPPANPWVGPRPFGEGDSTKFFGRESETEILTSLVLSRQAVLLFAPSGAGKSSLIRAGLTPELHKEELCGWGEEARLSPRMRVLPIASARGTLPPRLTRWPANPFVFGVLHSLFRTEEPDSLVDLRLEEGLSRIDGAAAAPVAAGEYVPSALPPALLVIDQFEQIYEDAEDAARVMAIVIHPYIMGAPHRTKYFRRIFEKIRSKPDVAFMTGEQIYDWFVKTGPKAP